MEQCSVELPAAVAGADSDAVVDAADDEAAAAADADAVVDVDASC